MWFSLFALVLILTITFFQGLQGLFSALIGCVLTVLAAALAFGSYEDVYYAWLIDRQPDHGRAIAFMAIFIVTLLVLRVLFDLLVTGNMRFPLYVDRAAGGALGFVTAMLIVGMLAIGIQMLPVDTTFLGFARYELVDRTTGSVLAAPEDEATLYQFRAQLDWSKVEHRPRSLWLSPERFTAGVIGHLSGGSLRGRNALADVYPNFLGSLHNARSGHCRESRHTAGLNAIQIDGFWDMPARSFYVRDIVQPGGSGKAQKVRLKVSPEPPRPGYKWIVVRVRIDADARDSDNLHRFTTQQFRIVTRDPASGRAKEFFLAGVNYEQADRWVRLSPGEGVVREFKGTPLVDLVFEVPDSPEFKPLFLEYKQNARAEFRPTQDKSKAPPKPIAPPKKPKPEGEKPTEDEESAPGEKPAGHDRVSGLGPARKDCVFGEQLPFTLTDYDGVEVQVAGGELRGARRLLAPLDGNWQPTSGAKPPIERFEVPESVRLLHLSVEKLQPQSWLGSLYGGVIDTIGNFYLIDEGGKEFLPVGCYAMARVAGRPVFELIYLDDVARGNARLPRFERIKPRELQGDYALFYLFHLPPGTKPAKLNTGRTAVDLAELNLVAPP